MGICDGVPSTEQEGQVVLKPSPEFCLKLTYRYLYKADHVPGDPGAWPFWPQGHNLNKLGRRPKDNASYQISTLNIDITVGMQSNRTPIKRKEREPGLYPRSTFLTSSYESLTRDDSRPQRPEGYASHQLG